MQGIGIARIGRDVEVRYTPDSTAVAQVSLAFSYGQKQQDGKRPTQWVDASLRGKRAESLAPYLLKGQLVYVSLDDLHIEEYQTRDGRQGSKLVGRVAIIEFAGGPPSQSEGQRPAPAQRQAPPARTAAPAPSGGQALADMDDDIPF